MVDPGDTAGRRVPGQGEQAQAALDFRALFESVPASCLVLDPDLVVVAVSDTYLRDTMTRSDDLIGHHVFHMFPENPDGRNASARGILLESFDRVRRTRQPDTLEVFRYDILRPGLGHDEYEIRYWSVRNVPVLRGDGSLGYIINRVEDVTEFLRLKDGTAPGGDDVPVRIERMEADIVARSQELAAANRALRRMAVSFEKQVAGAPDATIVVDRSGVIQMVNERALQMFGYDRRELAGSPVEKLVPESRQDVHARHRTAYAAHPRMRKMGGGLDLSGRRRDGSHFPVDISLYCAEVAEGLVVASVRDLTEHRKREETISRLAAIVESSDDAIYTVTHDHVISGWNKAAERLYGYTEREMIGRPVATIIPPGLVTETLGRLRGIVASGRTLRLETVRVRKDGALVDVAYSASPLRDATGNFDGTAAISQDITARKRAEERLAEQARQLEVSNAELAASNRELEQFAYVASHDLQEPLRKVSSFCQLLAEEFRDKIGDEADEYIGFVVDGAARMQQLINDLLTYSRIGRTRETLTDVDCNEVMRRVLADLSAAVAETGATVTAGGLPTVRGQWPTLVQLFENLVSNAIKFHGSQPPWVEVTARRSDGYWQFCITDNGIGIEPQYSDRIFAVFQRLHSRDEYPGTGIGLAVCKKIVETHGGRIWLDPAPGAGSAFHWTIPDETSGTDAGARP